MKNKEKYLYFLKKMKSNLFDYLVYGIFGYSFFNGYIIKIMYVCIF